MYICPIIVLVVFTVAVCFLSFPGREIFFIYTRFSLVLGRRRPFKNVITSPRRAKRKPSIGTRCVPERFRRCLRYVIVETSLREISGVRVALLPKRSGKNSPFYYRDRCDGAPLRGIRTFITKRIPCPNGFRRLRFGHYERRETSIDARHSCFSCVVNAATSVLKGRVKSA